MWFALLSVASAQTLCVRQTPSTDCYTSITEAIEGAVCGDIVEVHPGEYREHVSIKGKMCTESSPLIIRARNWAVQRYPQDGSTGSGGLINASRRTRVSGYFDFGASANQPENINQWVRLNGFEITDNNQTPSEENNPKIYVRTYIVDGVRRGGCEHCSFRRNYIHDSEKSGILLSLYSPKPPHRFPNRFTITEDQTKVIGNYFDGLGSDSGHAAIQNGPRGVFIAHNTIRDSIDGWNVDAQGNPKSTCRADFSYNLISNLTDTSDTSFTDGEAVDLKFLDCAQDPVRIHHNDITRNPAPSQVQIHFGSKGVALFNNTITTGLHEQSRGIQLNCSNRLDGCEDVSHIWILNTLITDHNTHGILLACNGTDCSRNQSVQIVNNTLIDNTNTGLAIDNATSDLVIANNLIAGSTRAVTIDSSVSTGARLFEGNATNSTLTSSTVDFEDYFDCDDACQNAQHYTTTQLKLCGTPELSVFSDALHTGEDWTDVGLNVTHFSAGLSLPAGMFDARYISRPSTGVTPGYVQLPVCVW